MQQWFYQLFFGSQRNFEQRIISIINFSLFLHSTVIAPDDYLPEMVPVTLSPGETETRVRVRTQRNILLEDNEHFKAIIIPCEGCDHVLAGVDTAFITITDCTGEHV